MNIDIVLYFILAVLLLLLFGVIGCSALFAVSRKKAIGNLEMAASPVLGISLMALQLWLYGIVGLPWNRITLAAPWIVLIVFAGKKLYRTNLFVGLKNKFGRLRLNELNSLSKMLIIISGVILLAYTAMLITQPLVASDFLAIWGLKSKEFYYHKAVFVDPILYKTIEGARFYHVDYPPLYPLMGDVLYVLRGLISETLVKIISFVFLISGLSALVAYLKDRIGQNKAIIFAFLLLGSPLFVPMLFVNKYMAYGDFPLTILMLLSTLFLLASLSSKKYTHGVLSLLFASFAACTKNEGLPFLLIIFALLVLSNLRNFKPRNIKIKPVLVASLIIGIILLPNVLWAVYKQQHGLKVDFSVANLSASGMSLHARLAAIRYYVWLYISTNPAFHWEIAALVLGVIGTLYKRNRESIYVLLLIAGLATSYILSYVFSPYDLKFHILSSIDRLLTQIFPIILLLLATIFFELKHLRRNIKTNK